MTKQSRNSNLVKQIDDNLRRVYSETLQEPVPDRFVQLLDQLRQKEQPKTPRPGDEDGADQ